MKISIHAGHNPDGKIASGAVGYIRESTEARKVVKYIKKFLKRCGITVYNDTVNNGISQYDVLQKIVSKIRKHDVDMVISVHFNAYKKEEHADGKTKGTEILIKRTDDKYLTGFAEKIVKSIATLGYVNRGVKATNGLYVLNNMYATPTMLIECCFVDDKDDVSIYNAKDMAGKIAEAIINETVCYEDLCVKTTVKNVRLRKAMKKGKKYIIQKLKFGTKIIVNSVTYKKGILWGKAENKNGKYYIVKHEKKW